MSDIVVVSSSATRSRTYGISVRESDADGTLVIQIDTPDIDEDINGPMIRVYLNDDVLFENPPYPVEN